MSRCVVRKKKEHTEVCQIAVGIERGLWFIQVFGPDDSQGYEVLYVDFEGSRWHVAEFLQEWSDLEDHYTKWVYDKVVADLDPKEDEYVDSKGEREWNY